MSKMEQIAALTAMLVVVIMYASPAKSAVCFLPDDDGSCGGGDIEISDGSDSDDNKPEEKCDGFTVSATEYKKMKDCFSFFSCTKSKNKEVVYKQQFRKENTTWSNGICCTNGEKYFSKQGQCCPTTGCACSGGRVWNPSTEQCECPEGKEFVGGVCTCAGNTVPDSDGNCVLPTNCTYSTETACNGLIWGTACQKDSNGCWWPSKCNKAGGYAELPARDCNGPVTSGDMGGKLGENGSGAACYKAVCSSGWKNGTVSESYDSSIFNVANVETQCATTCHQVFCKSSCKTGITSYKTFGDTKCPATCDQEKCEIKTSCKVELDERDHGSGGNVMNISGIPGYVKLQCDKAEVLANYSLTNEDAAKLISKVSTTCNIKYNCIVKGKTNYINLPVKLKYSASSNIDKLIPLSNFSAMRDKCKNEMGGNTLVRVSYGVDCEEASFNESGCSLKLKGIGKDCSQYAHAWHTNTSDLGITTKTPYEDCLKTANVTSCTKCIDGNGDEFAEISSCQSKYEKAEYNTKCKKIPTYLQYTCRQETGAACAHFLQGSGITCVNCDGIGGSGPEVANEADNYVNLLCLYDENKGYFTTPTNTSSGGSYIGHLRRCAMVKRGSKVPEDFCYKRTSDIPSCTVEKTLP